MVLLALLLLPAIFAAEVELNINNYIIKIEDDTLKAINAPIGVPDELNLSGLGLKNLDEGVFDNLSNVKNLNLANNSLSNLPELIFSNLTNLEYISLAENKISSFDHFFVGPKNIKCLNISYNPVEKLGSGWLFGLKNSSEIVTKGNKIVIIDFRLFENPFGRIENISKSENNTEEKSENNQEEKSENNPEEKSEKIPEDIQEKSLSRNNFEIIICIKNGIVKSLEIFNDDKLLTSDCKKIKIERFFGKLILRELNITGFEKGWYRLQDYPFYSSIDLDGNEIVQVTSEFFNELPVGIKRIYLRRNKIERLENGIIENYHLRELDLSNNFINFIEERALEKMNLTDGLYLDGNRLKDTKFAETLPRSLKELYLRNNEIAKISPGSFGKLDNLVKLWLDGNNITTLHRKAFNGPPLLSYLSLTNNNLGIIEPGAFYDLNLIKTLDLDNNLMSCLEKDLFEGLDFLFELRLSKNRFSKITKKTMAGLTTTLHRLNLDENGIESLEIGSFDHVPILALSLDNNKISKIERGSFNLPNLRHLTMRNNSLSEIDGDCFEGLKRLTSLSLAGNGIEKIEKGFAKHLGNLQILDLDRNPIRKLENGALYGLDTLRRGVIFIKDVPLEIIQGGLFEDL